MGDVAIAQGRVTTAETYYQGALAIQRQLYGESKSTVKILMKIGTARQKKGYLRMPSLLLEKLFKLQKNCQMGMLVYSRLIS